MFTAKTKVFKSLLFTVKTKIISAELYLNLRSFCVVAENDQSKKSRSA